MAIFNVNSSFTSPRYGPLKTIPGTISKEAPFFFASRAAAGLIYLCLGSCLNKSTTITIYNSPNSTYSSRHSRCVNMFFIFFADSCHIVPTSVCDRLLVTLFWAKYNDVSWPYLKCGQVRKTAEPQTWPELFFVNYFRSLPRIMFESFPSYLSNMNPSRFFVVGEISKDIPWTKTLSRKL